VRPSRPVIARHRAHVAALGQDRLRSVGRHPWEHKEPDVAEARRDDIGQAGGGLAGSQMQMQAENVLGDGQSDARAAELARMHVAVDPGARARPVGVGPEGQQPQIAPLRRPADGRGTAQIGECVCPGLDLSRQFVIGEETFAESERYLVEAGGKGRVHRGRDGSRAAV